MPDDRTRIRGTLLAEDMATERFFRHLLVGLGFDKRKFRFQTAPAGKGDAAAWVRKRYPVEVRLLRAKKHQRQLCLIAVRDGDSVGPASRKADLDAALAEGMLSPRHEDERVATPVPTWSIETWLFALLGEETVDERSSRKWDFERRYPPGTAEYERALRDAAQAWLTRANSVPTVPSLADGSAEMTRIDPP